VNVLLDTHALLWWLADDTKLSTRARDVIGNQTNQVFVSAVSGWEISIKQSLGKLDIDTATLLTEVEHNGFMLLPVHFQHGLVAGDLPSHHRDPFDRMLIAQAQCQGLQLISVDHCFEAYDVDVIW